MLILIALSLAAQPLDPLSQRMVEFCRSKPACIQKQRQGVREFLDIITRERPARSAVQGCLTRVSRKRATDWPRAVRCLRAENKRSRQR